ncbi:hypothetical protein N7495_002485 [Penicillium taxi]|uniref:uncharacterized protein n=1 Tax=Penicillium taxi TaxID=168475 RepID=UPI002545BAE1|nr:uncharacterized protein N7495_002485 [Penicillium taxi]KAJ5901957.1 hypothetical protein N7495_002485 [Penicillium taxi]
MLLQNRLYFLDTSISHYPNINGRILSCFPDGSDLQEVVTQIRSRPDGIAIDPVNLHIYWTNQGIQDENNGFIQRCDCDGRNIVTIIPKGVTWTPKQLKLAPLSKKLYWSDREGMRVMRANLDGSDVEVLHQAGQGEADKKDCCNWCVGIAVDEEDEFVYWTQKGPARGGQGRILRMPIPIHRPIGDFQTINPEVLLEGLPEPIDLDFDANFQQLWWTDRGDPPSEIRLIQ